MVGRRLESRRGLKSAPHALAVLWGGLRGRRSPGGCPTSALLSCLLLATALHAAPPAITKIDPPNWWIGHSINPVRVLIRGSGLTGARVEPQDDGLRIAGPVQVSANGSYLFADITVLSAGPHKLRIVTSDGSTTAAFDVLRPLPRAGRFQGFSPDDVVYQIMPDRFSNGDPSNDDPAISRGLFDPSKPHFYHGGDLRGIIDHLDYPKALGITALWITPIYDNVNHLNQVERAGAEPVTDYHGYGAVDFYGVEEHFGDLKTFQQLVEAAHQHGIKVILDMVANHTGPYHPWVADPPTPTWYHGTPQHHITETWQTWTVASPYAPAEFRRSTLDGWFADILPDLNQDDPEVARYLIQNTLWWVGISGLDGIREDTLPYVPRTFWRQWMAAIKREYPDLRVVGEMYDGDPALVSFFQGGRAEFDGIDDGVDALFDFPQHFVIRQVFARGESIRALAQMLGHDYLYPNPNELVTFLGLHDMLRFMSEKGATIDGLKLALTYLFTTRGIPMVYYGDEIAMRGGADPDNRRDFPVAAFSESGRTPDQQSVFAHVRLLAHLREQLACLREGATTQLALTEQTYVYARTLGSQTAVIALNNGAKPAVIECDTPLTTAKDLLNAATGVAVSEGHLHLQLPARAAAILVQP